MSLLPALLSLLFGCGEDPAASAPTWHADVAPIVMEKCAGCHEAGGIAPFALEGYEDAKLLAPAMSAAVDAGTMPPWFAVETDECAPPLPFKDDLRLSDAEKATLRDWAAAGAPEGDPATAVSIPEAPSLTLADADLRVTMSQPYTVEGSNDLFRCVVIDPGLTEGKWVTGVQVVPGNASVVHHVLVWADPRNQSASLAGEDGSYECFGAPLFDNTYMLSAWAPGAVPMETPPNTGMYLPAGAKIVLNMHYHPTGTTTELDTTSVDLRFADSEPSFVSEVYLVGNFDGRLGSNRGGLEPGVNDTSERPEFLIPAGAQGHVETMSYRLGAGEGPVRVWAVGTHMHYVGTDMKFWVERQDGFEECLIQTPGWDFNWQRAYSYDAPLEEVPVLNVGDRLWMRCTYDNSLENPFVRDALAERGLTEPVDVRLGEETLDEMCLGVLVVAYPNL